MLLKASVIVLGMVLMSVGAAAQEQPTREVTQPTTASQGQLSGRILGSHDKTLYLQGNQGLVVPIQVTKDTQVDGDTVGTFSRISKYLEQHYPKGAEVDIVFEVRHGGDGKMENVATSIQRK